MKIDVEGRRGLFWGGVGRASMMPPLVSDRAGTRPFDARQKLDEWQATTSYARAINLYISMG